MEDKDVPMSLTSKIASAVGRANMAIVVSAICVLGGLAYAIWNNNTDLVTFIAGAGIGYLLKDIPTKEDS